MNRLALIVGVALVLSSPTASVRTSAEAPSARQAPAGDRFDRLRAWLKAVRAHQFGVEDEPALTIASWSSSSVLEVLSTLAELVDVLTIANARDAKTGHLQPFVYNRRTYTRAQLLALLQL